MSWDVSITIECECDKCHTIDILDVNEPMDDDEIERYIEGNSGWEFKDGELLCEDCAHNGVYAFTDRCTDCWHRMGCHCPHYKESCEDVYVHHYEMMDDQHCTEYMPIGGKKNDAPKYKPTSASLDRFMGVECARKTSR